jgi:hypothetical protein
MTEQQREAKFRAEAKARTRQFSMQGKAITMQRQAQRQFESEYKAEAQKYASDIFAKQDARRVQQSPVMESLSPVGIQPSQVFEASTPASPTTRTDMGTPFTLPESQKFGSGATIEASKPFQYRTGFMVTDVEKYQQQQVLEQNKGVVVFGKSIPATASIQRGIDKYRFEYGEQTKQLDFHPILSEVAVPVAVGAVRAVRGWHGVRPHWG